MPIDFLSIQQTIQQMGAEAGERERQLQVRRQEARRLLEERGADLASLRGLVEAARAVDSNLRCAVPVNEALKAAHAARAVPPEIVLAAADGSQIPFDRHAAVQFALINIGAIVMRTGSGEAPQVSTQTELLHGEQVETEAGPLTEEQLSLRRDVRERSVLDELAQAAGGEVVVLTDGPLELWGSTGQDSRAYQDSVRAHVAALSRLQSRNAVAAGYVDKPGADLVVRLLELTQADSKQREGLRSFHPFRGVTDRWLFGHQNRDFQLLGPGERSAVFALQSSAEKHYTGALALHFFYLNVGDEGHAYPVRVEIPRWVADSDADLDLLQALLVDQCRMLGSRPYPYILHRAHETAVVTLEERNQVERRLMHELLRQGQVPDDTSSKQSAKDLAGRTRYERGAA